MEPEDAARYAVQALHADLAYWLDSNEHICADGNLVVSAPELRQALSDIKGRLT